MGFSPEDASKLWKNRSLLIKEACRTEPGQRVDASKVTSNLEAATTRLIGNSDYDAFVSRVRALEPPKGAKDNDRYAKHTTENTNSERGEPIMNTNGRVAVTRKLQPVAELCQSSE